VVEDFLTEMSERAGVTIGGEPFICVAGNTRSPALEASKSRFIEMEYKKAHRSLTVLNFVAKDIIIECPHIAGNVEHRYLNGLLKKAAARCNVPDSQVLE
jgi:hypothetical protein